MLADQLRRTHPQIGEESLQRERLKAFRAPLIVVVAARCEPIAKIPDIEQTLAAGAAAHAMMLAAFALGFNAMWKTGDAAYDAAVKQALGLEPADAIVGLVSNAATAANERLLSRDHFDPDVEDAAGGSEGEREPHWIVIAGMACLFGAMAAVMALG
jgi:nitroreductase